MSSAPLSHPAATCKGERQLEKDVHYISVMFSVPPRACVFVVSELNSEYIQL